MSITCTTACVAMPRGEIIFANYMNDYPSVPKYYYREEFTKLWAGNIGKRIRKITGTKKNLKMLCAMLYDAGYEDGESVGASDW